MNVETVAVMATRRNKSVITHISVCFCLSVLSVLSVITHISHDFVLVFLQDTVF